MHRDMATYAMKNMVCKKLRSWLTILGVIIGIAAIVAIVSISQGLDSEIRGELDQFGSNFIDIAPGTEEELMSGGQFVGSSSGLLTEEDLRIIRNTRGVKSASSAIMGRVNIEYKGEEAGAYAIATEPQWFEDFDDLFEIEVGRPPGKNERGYVFVGNTVANDLFKEKIMYGQKMYIEGRLFKVIAVGKESDAGVLTSAYDSMIIINKEDGRAVIGQYSGNDYLVEIWAWVEEGEEPEQIAELIEGQMLKRRRQTEENKDFTIMTAKDMQETISSITGAVTLFVGGVAAISLAVGGIGIMNTMFMSVIERTREIGTLKAIGASEKAILELFLIESALIGGVGGGIGIAIGLALGYVGSIFGVPFALSWEVVAFAFVFSLVVGIASGVLPARRAAKLEAMDALRYE